MSFRLGSFTLLKKPIEFVSKPKPKVVLKDLQVQIWSRGPLNKEDSLWSKNPRVLSVPQIHIAAIASGVLWFIKGLSVMIVLTKI